MKNTVTHAEILARLKATGLTSPKIEVHQQGSGCLLFCGPHQISDVELALIDFDRKMTNLGGGLISLTVFRKTAFA